MLIGESASTCSFAALLWNRLITLSENSGMEKRTVVVTGQGFRHVSKEFHGLKIELEHRCVMDCDGIKYQLTSVELCYRPADYHKYIDRPYPLSLVKSRVTLLASFLLRRIRIQLDIRLVVHHAVIDQIAPFPGS